MLSTLNSLTFHTIRPSTEHTEPQRLENGEDRLDSEEKQINSTSTTTPPAQTEEQSNAASSTTDTPVESPDVNQPSGQASTESTSAMRAMASFYSMVDDHLLQTIELNAKCVQNLVCCCTQVLLTVVFH